MKKFSDKFARKSQVMAVALVIFSIFVGLSCVAAADVTNVDHSLEKNDILKMTVKCNPGSGFHWEVSPKTHGATLMTKNVVQDNPGTCGDSETVFYSFLKQQPDAYVQLALISPSGNVVKVVDSDMLN